MAITLWLLIFIGIHDYPTVPGIASNAECERLFSELKAAGYSRGAFSNNDHLCISYQGIRP